MNELEVKQQLRQYAIRAIVTTLLPIRPPKQDAEMTRARLELQRALTAWFYQFDTTQRALDHCPALCVSESMTCKPKPWPKDDPSYVELTAALARAKLLRSMRP